jgi:hypothetical protein
MSDEPETPFSKAVMESMSTDAPEPKTQDTGHQLPNHKLRNHPRLLSLNQRKT